MPTTPAKVDKRVRKTREVLCLGLVELLKNQPLKDITVSDLCQYVKISRATFYNNFSSLREVLEAFVLYKFSNVEKLLHSDISDKTPKQRYQMLIHEILVSSFDSDQLLVNIMARNDKASVYMILFEFVRREIDCFLTPFVGSLKSEEEKSMMAYSQAGALTGVLYYASHEGRHYSEKELEKVLLKTMLPNLSI